MKKFNIRIFIINLIVGGGVVGSTLGFNGITIYTYTFWIIMSCVGALIVNNTIR